MKIKVDTIDVKSNSDMQIEQYLNRIGYENILNIIPVTKYDLRYGSQHILIIYKEK